MAFRGTSNLKLDRLDLWTHAQAPSGLVVNVRPLHLENCGEFGLLNGFCSDDDLATVLVVLSKGEVVGEDLSLGSHDCAHRSLSGTNRIIVTTAIPIDHLKLELLILLKVVVE